MTLWSLITSQKVKREMLHGVAEETKVQKWGALCPCLAAYEDYVRLRCKESQVLTPP